MESYFHRAGRRVPVYVSTCAFVVPRPAAAIPTSAAWRVLPLARRHALVVRQALIDRAGGDDRGRILRRIRLEARDPTSDDGPPPIVDAAPVLTRGALLLCPTGAVVAQFPEGTSPGAAAAIVGPTGWRIERPIRFLERGYVLRVGSDGADVDPLELANRLVEDHGCRFAHPVLLEQVVGSADEAPAADYSTGSPASCRKSTSVSG